ncbi:MAG: ferrous iron transport protein A [Acidobacteria bacterium]|nr:ferrous iron transport protein A [Acidobacteriota bacterium]
MTTLPMTGPTGPLVNCPLCGLDYAPGGDTCKEHGCPLSFGTCATRHCPRCGYTIPDEERSVAVRLARKLLGRREPLIAESLAQLPAGARAVVSRLQGDPELLSRLTAQGIAPGVTVHLVQRSPTYVIEIGETTIAVERRVAEAIRLRPDGPR